MSDSPKDFELPADITPRETKPFKLSNGKTYILREATEDAATEYHNGLLRSTKLADGKVCGIEGMADVQPKLVAKCLFEIDPQGPGSAPGAVTVGFVRTLTSRVVKPMFEWVKTNSDLDRTNEENPVRTGLFTALEKDDAPITKDEFVAYVKKLAGEDKDRYGDLWTLVKLTAEDEAKKLSPGGTVTSGFPTS